MELMAVELPEGNPDQTLDDLIQEYLLMGWSPSAIFFLFRTPAYAFTHRIYLLRGEQVIRDRILRLSEEWNQGWIRKGAANASGI